MRENVTRDPRAHRAATGTIVAQEQHARPSLPRPGSPGSYASVRLRITVTARQYQNTGTRLTIPSLHIYPTQNTLASDSHSEALYDRMADNEIRLRTELEGCDRMIVERYKTLGNKLRQFLQGISRKIHVLVERIAIERGKEGRRNTEEDVDEKLSTLLRGRSPVGYVTCDS
ncbi:hypothetical protein ALC60_05826 [Trachymyrmex zeteki]|uniref:Uncharacterized protein n=1 Tax=Mycetomoellerius zeteki TaxID=64791 RepID=A0A151X4A5_9HYME|nr:hypothetical protein ALC60_05826 [Trachymyrmex zeteki]